MSGPRERPVRSGDRGGSGEPDRVRRRRLGISAARALARVERRQVLRHRRRSLLVLALVAVPVAAVVGAATLVRITEPTPEERAARAMGRASLRIETSTQYSERERVGGLLPPEARVQVLFVGQERVRTPGRQLHARSIAMEPVSLLPGGLASGMFLLSRGRGPDHPGEVALSPVILEGLGCDLGDTVTLAYGGARTICGEIVDPEDLDASLVLRTPAASELGTCILLVDVYPGEATAAVAALRAEGISVRSRDDVTAGGNGLVPLTFVAGAIGFFEAALVIAAAFAVGLRRRQHEIGLLGSVGATSRGVVLAILFSAGTVALAGGLIGAIVGSSAAAALHPFLDAWNRRLNGPFEVAPPDILAGIFLGVLAAMIAAAAPAWGAARVPIRDALGATRPSTSRSHRWLAAGVAMVASGVALLVVATRGSPALAVIGVIGGPILGVVGFGAASPWILDWIARRAHRLPLVWRLSLRDAGRFRARNGPAVTAILAAMSLTVTAALLVRSVEAALDAFPAPYRDDQILVEGPDAEGVARRIAAELPAVATVPLMAAYAHGEPVRARFAGMAGPGREEWVACGDEELLVALGLEAWASEFRKGEILALDPPESSGALTIRTWLDGHELPQPPVARVAPPVKARAPLFVLSGASLDALGMYAGPPLRNSVVPWIVRLESSVTRDHLDRARALAAASVATTIDASLLHGRPAREVSPLALAISALTSLIVVLVAVALSAEESAADERVLHSVGAGPRHLRSLLAARAGYLAFLGSVLAVPAGVLTAFALVRAANFDLDLVVPWIELVMSVIGLPSIAYAGAWLVGLGRESSACRRVLRQRLVCLTLLAMPVGEPAIAMAGAAGQEGGTRVGFRPDPIPGCASIAWESYTGSAFDGSPLAGKLGRFRVPERRDAVGGGEIELAFVRFQTRHPDPGPPIFFLAGGPGASGVETGARVATHPQIRLLEQRDVIALDQRGTGLSRPNLEAGPDFACRLPPDRRIGRQDVAQAFYRATGECVAHWRAEGVDPGAYNTEESARDLEDLRLALGLDEIVLYGSSYGSHLGLAYLRLYPDRVSRAVFWNVEGPGQTWKLPSLVQGHLEKVASLVAADPSVSTAIPDLLGLVESLLHRLDQDPPVRARGMTAAGDTVALTLSPLDLQLWLSNALGSSEEIARIPRVLVACARGEWRPLAGGVIDLRCPEVPAMPVFMDCASGATNDRRLRIERERTDPANLLGDAIHAPFFPSVCSQCGLNELGDSFRTGISCDVPVLFISGTLDARTPVENVEAIRDGFSHYAHVVVENAAHDSRALLSPDFRELLQGFLRGDAVASCRIALPPIQFDPVAP